jgi:hypothetical protein
MTFEPGDRVRSLYSGKTGIVVSEPRRRDLAQGDAVSGVTVDVLLDEAPPGSGPVTLHIATLTRLDGPDTVVMIDPDDDEVIVDLVKADPRRGAESVEQAARRLQNQITHIVRRAAELDPTFRELGNRVSVGKAMEVVEASGAPLGLRPEYLERLRSMEVNLIVSHPENPK